LRQNKTPGQQKQLTGKSYYVGLQIFKKGRSVKTDPGRSFSKIKIFKKAPGRNPAADIGGLLANVLGDHELFMKRIFLFPVIFKQHPGS
jgi:hypothetical protein